MKHFVVVAAIIVNDNKILCMQRKESKYEYTSLKYEFPGGKVEEGETLVEALEREIMEELDLPIWIIGDFLVVNHDYPDFSLTMHSFLCRTSLNKPTLKEHVDFKWLLKDQLTSLDWAAADIPIVNKLIESSN